MAVNVPAGAACFGFFFRPLLRVNGDHDALRAVLGRCVFNDLRVGNGRGVKTGFVSPGVEQPPHVIDRTHTATHRQRDKHLAGHRLDDVQNQIPSIAGGRDV